MKKKVTLFSFSFFFNFFSIVFLFVFVLSSSLFADVSKVKLKADDLIYHSETNTVTATGNVKLSYGGVEIMADQLDILNDQTVVGSRNITIKRGQSEFNPTYLDFNLSKNAVTISDIAIQIENHEKKSHPIYLRAKQLTDLPNMKKGLQGIITSCDHYPPHYYATASHFDYFPDERVVAFNVSHYNPLLGVPFYLWTPAYSYDLGNRRIVWNFPTIGKKETRGWGWFMQNTFDYDRVNGKDSSVYIDWFIQEAFPATKGWGLGIQHQYEWGPHSGSVYFYELEESDTKNINNKKALDYVFKPGPFLTLDLNYHQKQGSKINYSGFENIEEKKLNYDYNELGNIYKMSLYEKQNFHSPKADLSASFSHTYNDRKYVDFSWSQNKNYVAGQESNEGALDLFTPLNGASLKNNIKYYEKNQFSSDQTDVRRVRYTSTYLHNLGTNVDLGVNIASQIPLSELSPTANSSDYDMFYKLPEVKLSVKKQSLFGFTLNQHVTVARYQERRFSASKNRDFPLNDDFSIEPNTYAYTGSASTSVDKLPFSSTFKLNGDFMQYVFKTPDKDLFEGDAFYKVSLKPSITSHFFGFIKTQTTYDWAHVPEDANSPFQAFSSHTSVAAISNKITETITFDILNKDFGYWKHASGYDWLRQKPNNYSTHLSLKPATFTKLDITTGRNLEIGTWHNLDSDISYTPTKNQSVSFGVEQDLNLGTIKSSTLSLKFPIGDDPDYQWAVSTQFSYVPTDETRIYEFNKYELKSLHITKHDHCRIFDISYSKPKDELTFSLTIQAFPNDKIGIKKTKNLYKLEGILDETSKERL